MSFLMFFYILDTLAFLLKTNNIFDITCLNLERCRERRVHIDSIMNFAGCRYSYFNAVDGKLVMTGKSDISEYSPNIDISHYVIKHQGIDSIFYGVVGLKLSSYVIFKQMELSGNTKPLLILEDDVDLNAEFVYKVENTLRAMDRPWDIILLSSIFWPFENSTVDPNTGLVPISFFTGTYAYLVNGCRAATKLANLLDICPPTAPIDHYFGKKCETKVIEAFAYKNFLATHLGNVFGSTIETSWYIGPSHIENSLYWMVKNIKSFRN